MNILLTGGTGYIGSHAAVVLAQAGHGVVLYDNLCNSRADVASRLAQIVGRPVPLVQGDVRDTDLLERTLQAHGIHAVMHFAGLKSVGESITRPLAYYENNVAGTLSLLRAMQGADIRTLVFSSTANIYGAPHYLPVDEAHPMAPINPYGRSKLQVEQMLADLAVADAALRVVCLRYFNPVGAHDSGLIGEDPGGTPDNLMPVIAQVASGRRAHLDVYGRDYPTPDGTGVRDYIHVMDLADGHLAALDFLAVNTGWHAVNLGTGRGYSVLEMVRAFEAASGRAVPCRIVGRRAGDVASCYASADKARTMLGWQARRALDDMCASTWNWQQQNEILSS
jgi:UDP-glucose 4-epimerase